MRILFLTNIPSPYRVAFFNCLGTMSELTVLFEKQSSDERNDSWKKYNFENFKGIFLSGRSVGVDQAVCFDVIKHLKKGRYDRIIVANAATPTGIIAIEHMRLNGTGYFIEGDGGFPKDGAGIKEKFKRHLLKGALGYFSTARMHDKYYMAYGARPDKIFRYPFTSVSAAQVLTTPPDAAMKRQLRQELGILEEKIVLSVGQFIHRKGYDVLMRACQGLDKNVGIYIVGGKPTEEYSKLKETYGLSNLHFVDFMNKEKISKYYMAADVFVLPTREDIWGLVINEAMVYGLPIITTDHCIAGLELVTDGENGYIVPIEDDAALTECMNKILQDPVLCTNMAESSLAKIASYTIENMAARHIEILQRAPILHAKGIL